MNIIKFFVFFIILQTNYNSMHENKNNEPITFLKFCQKNKVKTISGIGLSGIGLYLIHKTWRDSVIKLEFLDQNNYKKLATYYCYGSGAFITLLPFFSLRKQYKEKLNKVQINSKIKEVQVNNENEEILKQEILKQEIINLIYDPNRRLKDTSVVSKKTVRNIIVCIREYIDKGYAATEKDNRIKEEIAGIGYLGELYLEKENSFLSSRYYFEINDKYESWSHYITVDECKTIFNIIYELYFFVYIGWQNEEATKESLEDAYDTYLKPLRSASGNISFEMLHKAIGNYNEKKQIMQAYFL